MSTLSILLQRLLPQVLLGRLVYRIARSRLSWLKNALIRGFCALFPVDLSEAEGEDPGAYASFNDFFTRRLKPDARPLDPDPMSVLCPADGRVQQCGRIEAGTLLQAKGFRYSAAELLGDEGASEALDGGWFWSIYLAPQDYHRVHAPLDGTLRHMTYLPGARLSVNESTAAAVPGLFARNERLVCRFETATQSYALVLVGALNVASISTAWAGEVLPLEPRSPRRWHYPGGAGVVLSRGQELGHFNLGSTVILLLPECPLEHDETLQPGTPLRMGQSVARLR